MRNDGDHFPLSLPFPYIHQIPTEACGGLQSNAAVFAYLIADCGNRCAAVGACERMDILRKIIIRGGNVLEYEPLLISGIGRVHVFGGSLICENAVMP